MDNEYQVTEVMNIDFRLPKFCVCTVLRMNNAYSHLVNVTGEHHLLSIVPNPSLRKAYMPPRQEQATRTDRPFLQVP